MPEPVKHPPDGGGGRVTVSLRALLLLVFLAIILPSLAVQIGLHYYWFDARLRSEDQGNLELSRSMAGALDAYIRDLSQHEESVARTIESIEAVGPVNLNFLLRENAYDYPALRKFLLIDPAGKVVASSDDADTGLSVAGSDYFIRAVSSNQPVVTDAFWLEGDKPAFVVARSIRSHGGPVHSVVAAVVAADELAQARLTVNPSQGCQMVIFDRKGQRIYEYPARRLSKEQRLAPENGELLKKALAGREVVGTVFQAGDREERMVARVPAAGIGWVVGTGHPMSQVTGVLTRRLFVVNAIQLAAIVVSAIIVVLIGRSLSKSIASLRQHAAAIGRGEWREQSEPSHILEVGELGRAFDHMAAAREQAESKLQQLVTERDEQRAFLQRLVDVAPIGVAVIDPATGRYIMANAMYQAIPGKPGLSMVGGRVGDFAPPQTAEFMRELLRRVLETRQLVKIREFEASVGPGREHTFWNNDVVPLLSQTGSVEYVLAITQEVTEQVMIRKRIEELATQLKAANDALEQRVAARTAELQRRSNQLRALVAELNDLEARERRRLAELLHDNLQQLLVGAKLNLWAIRTEEQPIKDVVSRVEGLLNEAIAASRLLTVELSPPILYQAGLPGVLGWLAQWMREKHGLSVEAKLDEQANPADQGIRILLFQSARELLFNVVKHAGVKEARIELSRAGEQQVRVVVADQGSGFDFAKVQSQLASDAGFGIFSIRERLATLGGHMDIQSEPGQGTTVTLLAPMRLAEAPEPAEQAPPRLPSTARTPVPQPMPGPIRVVLADDHDTVRAGLASLLREEPDMQVVGQARDGVEALEFARALRPDVVVMDVTMPHMDGVLATRRIKAELPQVEVIGLSMHAEVQIAKRICEAGASACLMKGGPPESLLSAIRRSVKKASARPRKPPSQGF